MTTVIDALQPSVSHGFDSTEWDSIISGRHNALLEGPREWTDAILWRLGPRLCEPVIWMTPHSAGTLPAGRCGALVLQDVASLRRDDQARLVAWMDGGHRHVISTTMHPLFPLIAAGVFDEALYYRLNVVRMSAHE